MSVNTRGVIPCFKYTAVNGQARRRCAPLYDDVNPVAITFTCHFVGKVTLRFALCDQLLSFEPEALVGFPSIDLTY